MAAVLTVLLLNGKYGGGGQQRIGLHFIGKLHWVQGLVNAAHGIHFFRFIKLGVVGRQHQTFCRHMRHQPGVHGALLPHIERGKEQPKNFHFCQQRRGQVGHQAIVLLVQRGQHLLQGLHQRVFVQGGLVYG